MTSIAKEMEKLEPSHICVENVKSCSPYGNVWKFLSMLHMKFLCVQGIPLLSENIYPNRNLFTNISRCIHHTAKMERQTIKPSTDKGINTMWSVCTMGHYLALKEKEVMVLVITLMNFEDNSPSERNQTQRHKISYSMQMNY